MRVFGLLLLFFCSLTHSGLSQTKGATMANLDSLASQKIQNLNLPLNTNNRLALVIGNADYTKGGLKNPVHDAEAIRDALMDKGFSVIYKQNIHDDDIGKILTTFGDSVIKNNGVNLFYYSGHGIQHEGENYFLPIDADLKELQDIRKLETKLQYVMDKMSAAQRALNIIILDACRTTPFESMKSKLRQGLSDIDNCPLNTSVFYAPRPNHVAFDGNGKNSPFTEALLSRIRSDSVEFYEIARRVTRDVLLKTNKQQCPVLLGMTYDPFYFKQKKVDRKPDLFIVSIGISKYQDPRRSLKYGFSCAMDFYDLMSNAAYKSGDYGAVNKFVLGNEDATRANILKLYFNVMKKVREGDVLLFYYRGWLFKTQSGKPYLVPVDGDFNDLEITSLPCDQLFSLLTRLPCKSILFLDKTERASLISNEDPRSTVIEELNSPANNTVVVTTDGDQAFESSELRTTIFLYSLQKAMEQNLAAKGKVDVLSFSSEMSQIALEVTGGRQILRTYFPKGWLNFTLYKK